MTEDLDAADVTTLEAFEQSELQTLYINVGAEARTLTGNMYVAGKPRAQDGIASKRPLPKPAKKAGTMAAKLNANSLAITAGSSRLGPAAVKTEGLIKAEESSHDDDDDDDEPPSKKHKRLRPTIIAIDDSNEEEEVGIDDENNDMEAEEKGFDEDG